MLAFQRPRGTRRVLSAAALAAPLLPGPTVLAASEPEATTSPSSGLMVVAIASAALVIVLLVLHLIHPWRRRGPVPDKAVLRGIAGATDRHRSAARHDGDRDPEPGYADRRRLDRDVRAHVERRGITAVMQVEVDRFDEIVERSGRRPARRLVREIGDVLSANVRLDDVVYRLGEHEFCILLPEATVTEGRLVATRLIAAVHQLDPAGPDPVTVSIGISGTHDGRVGRALGGAHSALAEAKRAGRDRVGVDESG